MPAGVLASGSYPGLITRPPPVEVPSFGVGVAWHARRDRDPATRHVVHTLVEVASGIQALGR